MNVQNHPPYREDDPAHDYEEASSQVDWDLEDEFLDSEEAVVGLTPVEE
ncbi:MAG TPA: hypothetical protein VLI70_10130 [Micrococcaceae bacterium]|jgi:hypothetical protein|nr:hypothetical protein [Micrococcaceae bacterium]